MTLIIGANSQLNDVDCGQKDRVWISVSVRICSPLVRVPKLDLLSRPYLVSLSTTRPVTAAAWRETTVSSSNLQASVMSDQRDLETPTWHYQWNPRFPNIIALQSDVPLPQGAILNINSPALNFKPLSSGRYLMFLRCSMLLSICGFLRGMY